MFTHHQSNSLDCVSYSSQSKSFPLSIIKLCIKKHKVTKLLKLVGTKKATSKNSFDARGQKNKKEHSSENLSEALRHVQTCRQAVVHKKINSVLVKIVLKVDRSRNK